MSLLLGQGTVPHHLSTKIYNSDATAALIKASYGSGGYVSVGDYVLTMKDLLALTVYALTNTNLEGEEDPRVDFVKAIRFASLVDGHPRIECGKRTNPNDVRYSL